MMKRQLGGRTGSGTTGLDPYISAPGVAWLDKQHQDVATSAGTTCDQPVDNALELIAAMHDGALLSPSPSAGDSTRTTLSDAGVGEWFVIHTLARQEKALANDLAALGVQHFLPLHSITRFYGKRKAVVEEPLFPGYLFLRGRRDDAFRADRTRRVASILTVADQASLVDDLEQVRLALASRETLLPSSLLEIGVRVEVTSGALKGLRGKVTRVDSRSRLVISVDLIGRAASLEIDGSLLRVIG